VLKNTLSENKNIIEGINIKIAQTEKKELLSSKTGYLKVYI
jgi:hypothetical protein